ncbi:type III secretion system chaperone [Porticoccus sp. W117]|uniref:type III secretion system chaperone n=1 Tax=Porticoccus sp. W117 TaxID=3054777 RepID=UPI00259293E3|nr:type III secretion system chaperone [Porticoccus sp. W117]MDM3872178.1 type III secretion system chaperone [Porticoccus sp. W117]
MNNRLWAWLALILATGFAYAAEESTPQSMSQQQLNGLIEHYGENVKSSGNAAEFVFDEVDMLVVSDANADRMRIVSPIAHISNVEPQMVVQAMAANFHSVLDARYALGEDGTIYAAFIHPLSPLTEQQLLSALRQVASASETFGSTFTSGELVFPGSQPRQAPPADSI